MAIRSMGASGHSSISFIAARRALTAGLRRLKQWSWCGGMALAMLIFTVVPLLIAWDEVAYLNAAIWIGAGGGGLLGVAGGVFGVIADLRRARINRRYRELTSQPAA